MIVTKLRRTLTELGPVNGLLYLLNRFLIRISNGKLRIIVYYLIAQPVPKRALLPPHRGQNIQVRRIEAHDPEAAKFPRPHSVLQARYDRQGLCLAAYKEGKFVGFLWLNLAPYHEDEVRCLFTPHPAGAAAWDYDVYIEPDHRLGLAFARLWDAAYRLLREHNIAWSVSRISAFAPASLASHNRLGGMRIGVASFICAGPAQIMIASVAPYLHVSFSPASCPRLILDVSRIEVSNPTEMDATPLSRKENQ